MTTKQLSFFSLLLITSFISAKSQNFSEYLASEFQIQLDKFNKKCEEHEQAWLKAKDQCEETNNCVTCELFLQLSVEKKVFDKKRYLIDKSTELHKETTEFGVENVINLQRAITRIIKR